MEKTKDSSLLMNDQLKPGSRHWRVLYNNGEVEVQSAWFVHKKGSWYRWRNIYSGTEWNEQGLHFYSSIRVAVEGLVCEVFAQALQSGRTLTLNMLYNLSKNLVSISVSVANMFPKEFADCVPNTGDDSNGQDDSIVE